ncbi:hypothetical protein HDV05_006551 [Chytridiales sp. JEL 0842]|nr:hypothetical protein HDV05_006551 [Chytridiales sp. JEL 0842]
MMQQKQQHDPSSNSNKDITIHLAIKRLNYSPAIRKILLSWLNLNKHHPYPTEQDKATLASKTGLTLQQVNNWFINARRRKYQFMLLENNNNNQSAKDPVNDSGAALSVATTTTSQQQQDSQDFDARSESTATASPTSPKSPSSATFSSANTTAYNTALLNGDAAPPAHSPYWKTAMETKQQMKTTLLSSNVSNEINCKTTTSNRRLSAPTRVSSNMASTSSSSSSSSSSSGHKRSRSASSFSTDPQQQPTKRRNSTKASTLSSLPPPPPPPSHFYTLPPLAQPSYPTPPPSTQQQQIRLPSLPALFPAPHFQQPMLPHPLVSPPQSPPQNNRYFHEFEGKYKPTNRGTYVPPHLKKREEKREGLEGIQALLWAAEQLGETTCLNGDEEVGAAAAGNRDEEMMMLRHRPPPPPTEYEPPTSRVSRVTFAKEDSSMRVCESPASSIFENATDLTPPAPTPTPTPTPNPLPPPSTTVQKPSLTDEVLNNPPPLPPKPKPLAVIHTVVARRALPPTPTTASGNASPTAVDAAAAAEAGIEHAKRAEGEKGKAMRRRWTLSSTGTASNAETEEKGPAATTRRNTISVGTSPWRRWTLTSLRPAATSTTTAVSTPPSSTPLSTSPLSLSTPTSVSQLSPPPKTPPPTSPPPPPTVLITGCTLHSLGHSLALSFARSGCTVYATVRSPLALHDFLGLQTHPGKIKVLLMDLLDPESVRGCVAEIERWEGGRGVGVLVNCAGVGGWGGIIDEEGREEGGGGQDAEAVWRGAFEVNVMGTLRVTREVIRHLHPKRILNLGAPHGLVPFPFTAPYASSKAALRSLTSCLRMELAPRKVEVSYVVPGTISATNFYKSAPSKPKPTPSSNPDTLSQSLVKRTLNPAPLPPTWIAGGQGWWVVWVLLMLPEWMMEWVLIWRWGLWEPPHVHIAREAKKIKMKEATAAEQQL